MDSYTNEINRHEYVKYHLEEDVKKHAPHVPTPQILIVPPKGKWCNADYKFCPNLLWGGYCEKLHKCLLSTDGCEFTEVLSSRENHHHNIAVGGYNVFKKECGVNK
jgi:hypothetical protein